MLFLLGLLLLVPARRHRPSAWSRWWSRSLVTVAVLVPLAVAGWDLGFFGIGFWFAIASPSAGRSGLTRQRVKARARREGPGRPGA